MAVFQHYVGGAPYAGNDSAMLTIDPFREEEWARILVAGEETVDVAVAAARSASASWRKTPGVQRGRLLTALARELAEDSEHLAEVETRDNGKLLKENANQIRFAQRIYEFYAGYADKIGGESKALDKADAFAFTSREPYGTVGIITSWNSPLQILANKLGASLASGNTVVIKPSEFAAASTLEFAKTIDRVGFPDGVVNIVSGGAETGSALTGHPGIDKISFTGGVAAARRIAQNAAEHVTPLTLELGGKSANIIFPDADLPAALNGAVAGIFAAGGQSCVAGSRLLVHESIHDEVLREIVDRARQVVLGDPRDADTQMGPLANEAHLERVLAAVQRGIAEGARLETGGGRPDKPDHGLFMEPTVFADVDNAMSIAQQEIFGPVLSVIPFATEAEAVELANGTQFGLAAGVWSRDINTAHRVGRELRAGTVWINTYRTSAVQTPSGGYGLSGYGRERGIEGVLEFTQLKSTMVELSGGSRDPFVLGTGS